MFPQGIDDWTALESGNVVIDSLNLLEVRISSIHHFQFSNLIFLFYLFILTFIWIISLFIYSFTIFLWSFNGVYFLLLCCNLILFCLFFNFVFWTRLSDFFFLDFIWVVLASYGNRHFFNKGSFVSLPCLSYLFVSILRNALVS